MKFILEALFKLILFQFLIAQSKQKCLHKPGQSNTTCVDENFGLNGRVAGAEAFDVKRTPWQVSLRRTRDVTNSEDGSSHFCGGSWISQDWVLTAAHCIYLSKRMPSHERKTGRPVLKRKGKNGKPGMWVAFGESVLGEESGFKNDKKTKRKRGLRTVKKYIIHENYEHGKGYEFDIALLLLEPIKDKQVLHFKLLLQKHKIAFIKLPYPFNKRCKEDDVKLSKFPIKQKELIKKKLKSRKYHVSGFGNTAQITGGLVGMKLRGGKVHPKALESCRSKYKNEVITSNMLCALGEKKIHKNGQNSWVDAGKGDSGGPLVTKFVEPNNGTSTTAIDKHFRAKNSVLIGVVCAGMEVESNWNVKYVPGIYTKVCKFHLWIREKLERQKLDYPGSMCPTKLSEWHKPRWNKNLESSCTRELKTKMLDTFKQDYKNKEKKSKKRRRNKPIKKSSYYKVTPYKVIPYNPRRERSRFRN